MPGCRLVYKKGLVLTFVYDSKGVLRIEEEISRFRHCPKCGSNLVETGSFGTHCMRPGCRAWIIGADGRVTLSPELWKYHPTSGRWLVRLEVLSEVEPQEAQKEESMTQ